MITAQWLKKCDDLLLTFLCGGALSSFLTFFPFTEDGIWVFTLIFPWGIF